MKSGTSTLHHLLDTIEQIFIPTGETLFFSIDDMQQFPQAHWNGKWIEQDFEKYIEIYDEWHAATYAGASEGQILGADSPHYYCSRDAIDRIAEYCPDCKLIILLRDPVARLESHYWHWVRSGQAVFSLEDTIRFQHGNLLQRSCYEEHLRYCLNKFPKSQIKIIIFEQFIQNQKETLKDVLKFLSVDQKTVTPTNFLQANAGSYPKFHQLKLISNYLLRKKFGERYGNALPRMNRLSNSGNFPGAYKKVFRGIIGNSSRKPRNMEESTALFLSRYLRKRNEGLRDLISVDLSQYWKTFN